MRKQTVDFSEYYINNPGDLEECVPYIELIIRRSHEYKAWLNYIYNTFDVLTSDMFPGKNLNDYGKIETQVHHIVKLSDLVWTVGAKMICERKEPLMSFDVAREVMKLHMEDKVLCVVLTKTAHDAVHSGLAQITKSTPCVHIGNAQAFVNEYDGYITADILAEYENFGIKPIHGGDEK